MLTVDRQGNGGQDRGSTMRRNITVLSSTVLSNRRLVEKLNAAEAKAKRSRPVETKSEAYGGGSATEEGLASDDFEQELKIATAPRETLTTLPKFRGQTGVFSCSERIMICVTIHQPQARSILRYLLLSLKRERTPIGLLVY